MLNDHISYAGHFHVVFPCSSLWWLWRTALKARWGTATFHVSCSSATWQPFYLSVDWLWKTSRMAWPVCSTDLTARDAGQHSKCADLNQWLLRTDFRYCLWCSSSYLKENCQFFVFQAALNGSLLALKWSKNNRNTVLWVGDTAI